MFEVYFPAQFRCWHGRGQGREDAVKQRGSTVEQECSMLLLHPPVAVLNTCTCYPHARRYMGPSVRRGVVYTRTWHGVARVDPHGGPVSVSAGSVGNGSLWQLIWGWVRRLTVQVFCFCFLSRIRQEWDLGLRGMGRMGACKAPLRWARLGLYRLSSPGGN